mmetsp:Transcript_1826/g.4168  ORF Transcript_1826/g.4168 Transcript_1826/m.4168 type:complete len:205 (+) Transcript_1826:334-948(+)
MGEGPKRHVEPDRAVRARGGLRRSEGRRSLTRPLPHVREDEGRWLWLCCWVALEVRTEPERRRRDKRGCAQAAVVKRPERTAGALGGVRAAARGGGNQFAVGAAELLMVLVLEERLGRQVRVQFVLALKASEVMALELALLLLEQQVLLERERVGGVREDLRGGGGHPMVTRGGGGGRGGVERVRRGPGRERGEGRGGADRRGR